jgi:hypothetical protein
LRWQTELKSTTETLGFLEKLANPEVSFCSNRVSENKTPRRVGARRGARTKEAIFRNEFTIKVVTPGQAQLLLPISVGPHADIKMPSAIEVWAPWMDKKEAGARLRACQMVRNNRKGRSSVAGFNRPIHYPKLVY